MSYLSAFIKHSLQPARTLAHESLASVTVPAEHSLNIPNDHRDRFKNDAELTASHTQEPSTARHSDSEKTANIEQLPENLEIAPPLDDRDHQATGLRADKSAQMETESTPQIRAQQTHQPAPAETEVSQPAKIKPTRFAAPDNSHQTPSMPVKPIEQRESQQGKVFQPDLRNIPNDQLMQTGQTTDSSTKPGDIVERAGPVRDKPSVTHPAAQLAPAQQTTSDTTPLNNSPLTAVAPLSPQRTAEALFQQQVVPPDQRQQRLPQTTAIPQVRIGNINVLVEDRAAPKPARQGPTNTAHAGSNPFGLRGL